MTDREQTITDFESYLVRCSSRGDGKAVRVLKEKRSEVMMGHLYDGEQKGLQDRKLWAYARNRTCGFDPTMWLMILGLLFDLFKMWQEWRKPKESWGMTGHA